MEKDQVTIAVQASEIGRPLPIPIGLIGLSTNNGHRDLVVMWSRDGAFKGATRFYLGTGLLKPAEVDIITTSVGDGLYQWLANYLGIQGSFEGLP